MGLTYRDSGVDIDEGDALVERIKPHARRTMRPEVLAGIGGFGGLFEVPRRYDEPVLVVGTGGETAELPGFYGAGEYDLAGFCVGVVEKSRVLDGSRVRAGDVVIGMASSGLHSNGFSLARKVFEKDLQTVAAELLAPTKIYVKDCLALHEALDVHAFAHITGGGLPGNLPRILPAEHRAVLRRGSWPVPEIFERIQRRGDVAPDEMLRTFNMGVGMCAVV